jgi:hypothetical protein
MEHNHPHTVNVKIDVSKYISAISDTPTIDPFGDFSWGETRAETVKKVCGDDTFNKADNIAAICDVESWEPMFADTSNFENDDEWYRKLSSIISRHQDLFFPDKNVQLISSDKQERIGPIEIMGAKYDAIFYYSSLSPAIARQQNNLDGDSGEGKKYVCFDVEGPTICEFPPVLTRVKLQALDSTHRDICDRLLNELDQRYGEVNHVGSVWRYSGTSVTRSCQEIDYKGADYVYVLNYPYLYDLTFTRTQAGENDGASGL